MCLLSNCAFLFAFPALLWAWAEACDHHSWCNVTMHTATVEGELLCPHGAPLVAVTYQTRSGQESEWHFDCASKEDAQQYHSGSWTHEWNDTVVEQSFHCPPNKYVSGLRILGKQLLAGACVDLGSYVIDWVNCENQNLLTGRLNSTVKLDRRTVLISVNMKYSQSPFGWGWTVLTVCFTRRVKCEMPIIRHGHTHSRGTPDVVTGDLSTGVYRDVGENVTVTCDEGYYLQGGVASALCQQDGAWTSLPVCLRCRLIEDCKSVSCNSTEDSICLSCSSTGYTPFQLSPSRQSCDFAPWVSIQPVVWSGRQATISCTAHGRPAPSIHWELNGEVLSYTPTTVINSTALNASATVTVHGYYLCRTESRLGVDTQLIEISDGSTSLSYEGPPVIRREEFGHMRPLYSPGINESLVMQCDALGEPRPLIQWRRFTHNGLEPVRFSGRVELLGNGSLWFVFVRIADAGTYRCTAINKFGSSYLYYNLLVRDPVSGEVYGGSLTTPLILNWTSEYTAVVGQTVRMRCAVVTGHTLTVSWLWGRGQVDPASVVNGTLVIDSVQHEHGGRYTCVVTDESAASADTQTTDLTVIDPPIPNSTFIVSMTTSATATPTFTPTSTDVHLQNSTASTMATRTLSHTPDSTSAASITHTNTQVHSCALMLIISCFSLI